MPTAAYGVDVFVTLAMRGEGKHAATRCELILPENGGIIVDTPGMRELCLESANLSKTFADIGELASMCKFHACARAGEPGRSV